jgi:hypothetical protein
MTKKKSVAQVGKMVEAQAKGKTSKGRASDPKRTASGALDQRKSKRFQMEIDGTSVGGVV